jgi:hypothetical protein
LKLKYKIIKEKKLNKKEDWVVGRWNWKKNSIRKEPKNKLS